jgi:hypothetical protein
VFSDVWVATRRRDGGASPGTVGEWILVASVAVQHDTKTALAAFGRRHPGAVRPRGLMPKMLLMPTRQYGHPVLRFVLVVADNALFHVEDGSMRVTMHDHSDVCCFREMGIRLGSRHSHAPRHDQGTVYQRHVSCQRPGQGRMARTDWSLRRDWVSGRWPTRPCPGIPSACTPAHAPARSSSR